MGSGLAAGAGVPLVGDGARREAGSLWPASLAVAAVGAVILLRHWWGGIPP